MSIARQVQAARAGTEPALICQVPSGWVVLCALQFLRGYSILMPDPIVPSLNNLSRSQRTQYLCDMALVGDALLEVTGAYPDELVDATKFEYQRDRELIKRIAATVHGRLRQSL